jgi:Na+-driven multidrug efflux pump
LAEVLLVGKGVGTLSVRLLLVQMLSHAVIFASQNAGNFAERALLASDMAATAALGLGWTVFCLFSSFTTNVVGVCQLVVGRRTGDGDESGARAAARQALVLAAGGGLLGLSVTAAAGGAAIFTDGSTRAAALFLATQGLALGPLLAARALLGYFAGTMRVGPRLLAAVSVLPLAVHLALVWLLTGLLSWSVTGAGLARLGAAMVSIAAALTVAGARFGRVVGRPAGAPTAPTSEPAGSQGGDGCAARQGDRTLLWAMFTEGSVLGLQQVVAGLMVLSLYLRAACAGAVTSAALTLTHAGLYPLLFSFAWGSSQAVGAAAAQAVGRGDARELARVTRLGLGLSVVLAFALPWGAYAVCGEPTLAWLIGGSPAGGAMLAASLRFMGLLAVFFVFDFAINFLSALLKAAKEQTYLLAITVAVAAGFILVLLALPPLADDGWLMGTFIAAQAVWAGFLLIRVVTCWPCTTPTVGPIASRFWIGGHTKESQSGATCDGPVTAKHWSAAPGTARPCARPPR